MAFSLRALAESIQKLLLKGPQERARELDQPSGFETGLRHPEGGGYLLLRDQGIAELGESGAAVLMLDGPQSQATLRAAGIALEAEALHLHGQELYWGWHRFNDWWTDHPAPGAGELSPVGMTDPLLLWRAAVVPRGGPLAFEAMLRLPFVAGVPQAGQYNQTLAEYLELQPLFGANEELVHMLRHLADLLGDLGQHLED